MPKDKRPYITIEHGMPEHPKIEALSDSAFRLLVDLWCWCSRMRTDGLVSEAVWRKRGQLKARRELLAAGLAEHEGGDIRMHDYLEHQRSAAEIDELKAKRAAAGSRGGRSTASARASAEANLAASDEATAWAGLQQSRSKRPADTDTESGAGFSRGA